MQIGDLSYQFLHLVRSDNYIIDNCKVMIVNPAKSHIYAYCEKFDIIIIINYNIMMKSD